MESLILFIIWKAYQRRVDAFKERLGARAIYLHYAWEERSKLHKAVSYVAKFYETWRLLFRHKPAMFYVQAPPTFPVYAAFFYSVLTGAKYIVDAHNPMISGSFWNRMPLAKAVLRKAATVIVHNAFVAQQAQAQQLPHTVLMDRPPEISLKPTALPERLNGKNGRPRVVVPCSYDVDEPLAELQKATSELSHVDFYLTWYIEKMPAQFASRFGKNVIFTGFLPLPEFNGLLASADAILVLTTQDGTQPSGATEALAFAKPLIVSDLQIIRPANRHADSGRRLHFAGGAQNQFHPQLRGFRPGSLFHGFSLRRRDGLAELCRALHGRHHSRHARAIPDYG